MKVSRKKRNEIHAELVAAFDRLDNALIPEIHLDNRTRVKLDQEELKQAALQMGDVYINVMKLVFGVK